MVKGDRDPNRPKKAMSAYFIFMGDYRNHCKMTGEANTSNVTEFTKMASVKWKAMGDTEKAPYDARAQQDKQRYEQQMSMYVPAPGYSSKGSRKRKNPDAPKRPKSAYLHFLEAFREANRDKLNHKEIISQGASAWSRLTDDQKIPYNQKYEAEKEKYNALLNSMDKGVDFLKQRVQQPPQAEPAASSSNDSLVAANLADVQSAAAMAYQSMM